ncbi:MAG: hypothetical protein ACOCUU_01015 [Nanoarchaeota archaeon]
MVTQLLFENFLVKSLLVLIGIAIIFAIIIYSIEKKLKKKIDIVKNDKNKIYIMSANNTKKQKPEKAINQLLSLSKSFFRNKFNLKDSLTLTEISNKIPDKEIKEFCQKLQKNKYSGEKIKEKDLEELIEKFKEIVRKNKITLEEMGSKEIKIEGVTKEQENKAKKEIEEALSKKPFTRIMNPIKNKIKKTKEKKEENNKIKNEELIDNEINKFENNNLPDKKIKKGKRKKEKGKFETYKPNIELKSKIKKNIKEYKEKIKKEFEETYSDKNILRLTKKDISQNGIKDFIDKNPKEYEKIKKLDITFKEVYKNLENTLNEIYENSELDTRIKIKILLRKWALKQNNNLQNIENPYKQQLISSRIFLKYLSKIEEIVSSL